MTERNKLVGIFQIAPHTNLEACSLIVLLSHSRCLVEFCICQAVKCHDIHFLHHCLICMYVLLNDEIVSKKQSHFCTCGNPKYYIIPLINSFFFISDLTVWKTGHVD
jgi:hypothetical protein